jgi:hypothetical protein
MNPTKFYVDVTKRDLGEQIGNAMSVNVIERVLLRALQALDMIADSVEDRWKSGEALQEIRLTKGKFMKLHIRKPKGESPVRDHLRAYPCFKKGRSWIMDTGASITSLNKYKFYSLVALGQIKIKNEQDGSFTIANGDVVKGKIYVINKMKIGSYEIKNVEFSVLEEDKASNLLGLNALLQPTNSINIDINSGELSF